MAGCKASHLIALSAHYHACTRDILQQQFQPRKWVYVSCGNTRDINHMYLWDLVGLHKAKFSQNQAGGGVAHIHLAHVPRAGCSLQPTHAKGIMFKVACSRSGTWTKLFAALTGKIEVSRSFGDIQYKRFGMSAAPDIQVFNISPQDRFLLCACDGFWSCFGPQDAVKVVADLCQTGRPLKSVCDRLVYMVRSSVAAGTLQHDAHTCVSDRQCRFGDTWLLSADCQGCMHAHDVFCMNCSWCRDSCSHYS